MRQPTLCILLAISLSASAAENPVAISYERLGNVPNGTMDSVKYVLNMHTPQVLDKYRIDSMPPVTVKIWQNREDFEAASRSGNIRCAMHNQ